MSPATPDRADPGRLALLLSAGRDASNACWHRREFAAVWRHQLATPVQAEVGGGAATMTVGALLHHPDPPPERLDQLRAFAKSAGGEPAGTLPREIARVLYFACIAAGLAGGGRRLTSLDDAAVRRGIEWSLAQEWVDPPTRQLLSRGLAGLDGGTSGGAGTRP